MGQRRNEVIGIDILLARFLNDRAACHSRDEPNHRVRSGPVGVHLPGSESASAGVSVDQVRQRSVGALGTLRRGVRSSEEIGHAMKWTNAFQRCQRNAAVPHGWHRKP
jgi:hypothetical protein